MTYTIDDFEIQLNNIIQHLYDPSLVPPVQFLQVLGQSTRDGLEVMQTAIIQTIEDLRPPEFVPRTTRSWRLYGILYYRFVSNLNQDEVANRVSITPRHLRREQAAAIHLLAQKFWGKSASGESHELTSPVEDFEREVAPTEVVFNEAPLNPEMQIKNDLIALQESAPGINSHVNQVIKSVLGLIERLPAGKKLNINEVVYPGELKAALHPSALRQMLWIIIHLGIIKLEQEGTLSITCGVFRSNVFIDLAFSPPFQFELPQIQIVKEILGMQNGTLEISQDSGCLNFRIEIMHVNRTVLVVDDNPEIVHLYQRYLVGTAYHLIHLAKGLELFEQLSRIQPDLIVLDIMLPDVDGWDLLTQLTVNPESRNIPVIVCSVMSEKDLAGALGAFSSLAKPIQRNDFIHALDRASSRT